MKKTTMQADSEYSALSLSQRAHIIAKQGTEFYRDLKSIVLGFGGLIILFFVLSPPDPKSIVEVTVFVGIIGVIGLYTLYNTFKLKHLHQLFEAWDKDYLQQSSRYKFFIDKCTSQYRQKMLPCRQIYEGKLNL
jgi:hypothetical protein